MTDFSPDVQELLDESYESDLTEEESEQLLSMCGHGIGPKLSPAAQAVLDAAFTVEDEWDTIPMIAAAIRAAADQVLAVTWKGAIQPDTTHMLGINWSRDALQAIAAELEGAQ